MFAPLNSIEPHVQNLTTIDLFSAGEEWAKLRRPGAVDMVNARLANSRHLVGRARLPA